MGLTIGGPQGELPIENPRPDLSGFLIGVQGYQFRFNAEKFGVETFDVSAPGREGTIAGQIERIDAELGFLTPAIIRALRDGKRVPEESRQLSTREAIQRLIQSESVELVKKPQMDKNAASQSAGLLSGGAGTMIALGALAGSALGLLRSGGGSAQEGESESVEAAAPAPEEDNQSSSSEPES